MQTRRLQHRDIGRSAVECCVRYDYGDKTYRQGECNIGTLEEVQWSVV